MFEYLKSYLLYGNQFCGVEHTTKNDDSIIYSTVLKKSKKAVDLSEVLTSSSIEELASKLPKKQHVSLVINNEHVLTKTIKSEQADDFKLVNKAFPNIDVSEFYYEILKQDTVFFISICRQSYVDNLIKLHTENGLHVLSFSLGNAILANVIKYIDDAVIFTSNSAITHENGFMTSIDLKETVQKEQYQINGLTVTNSTILSFSGALNLVLNNYLSIINYKKKEATLFNTYKQSRFFSQFLKIGLISILGVLLVNFFFFNFYFKKVETLSETSQINQTAKKKIIKLKETVNKLQKTTDDMLKSSSSKSSFYINTIVNTLPESILLSQINYQPLLKKIKKDKTVSLQRNTIIVSGDSSNSPLYSEWISTLENIDWIDHIEVLDYSDLKTTTSHFSIKINMAHDK